MQPFKRFKVIVLLLLVININLYSQQNESAWINDFNYCFRNGADHAHFKEIFDICDGYIQKDSSNYKEKIAFYIVKACILSDSISPDTSIYYLKKILPYSLLTQSGEIITRNYWGIGRSYYKNSNSQKAIEFFLQQDYYAEKYGIKKEQVRASYYLSSCFQEIEDFDQSNLYAKKAYRIALAESDSFAVVRSLFGLSNNFISMELPDSALAYLNLSKDFIDSADSDNLAYYAGGVGRAYSEKKEFENAKYYQRKAIGIFEEINDGFGLSQATENMGHIYMFEGKYDSALIYLKKSEALNEMGFYGTPITLYKELYGIYKFTNDKEKAFKYLEKFVKEDSVIKKFDLRYINQLKDSFQLEKNDVIIQKEKEHLTVLFAQRTRYTLYVGIAILGIFVLAALTFYYRYKAKKDREQNLINSQLNEVRLRAFQSQMNPHFVFNCLATIDSYILQNRRQEASNMMERFSKLIRLVLENSKQDWISVEEDLKALRFYLELEQIRASKKFDFKIDVDESYHRLMIPPLIIQPFVENAIVHGVRNIEDGLIEICITKEASYLVAEIRDNGLGRKQADIQSNDKIGINKSSLGIALTVERMELVDKNKKSVYLEYTDLKDPSGTIARIYIPIRP